MLITSPGVRAQLDHLFVAAAAAAAVLESGLRHQLRQLVADARYVAPAPFLFDSAWGLRACTKAVTSVVLEEPG
jgi:hypothetical protein